MTVYVLLLASPTVMSDGTTQPTGTPVGRVQWDGVTPYHPAGYTVVPDTGQVCYIPAVVPLPSSSLMPLPQYMILVPQAVRLGMWSKMVSDTTLADNYNAWMNVVVVNGGIVDVMQPTLATLLNYCVSKSYMTQAQVNALLAVPPT
jgi:hypothetical protein